MSTLLTHEAGALVYLTFASLADLPWLRHGVATRRGGVSAGHLATLNLSLQAGDTEENVRENRRRFLNALALADASLSTAQQMHGTNVARATARPDYFPDTDGLVTDAPGAALLLLIADCPTVVVVDPARRAIGLGHAGWRGTVGGMAERLVDAMAACFGSRPAALLGAISPSIGPCCYTVGGEVIERLREAHPDDWRELLREQPDGGVHFDLWEANRRQLVRTGLRERNIEVAGLCSACRADLFFSHRRDRGVTGRFGLAAGIVDR